MFDWDPITQCDKHYLHILFIYCSGCGIPPTALSDKENSGQLHLDLKSYLLVSVTFPSTLASLSQEIFGQKHSSVSWSDISRLFLLQSLW